MGKGKTKDTQNLIIFLCWCVYTSAYFGRYSYSSSINSIIRDYKDVGVNNADTGLIATFFFVAYGTGQIINGFLCKKYSSRWTFPIALGSSSLINLTVFILMKTGCFKNWFFLLKYLWGLNGAVQSLIWTSLVFILGKNIDGRNIPRAGLIIGTTVPFGTFLAYGTSYIMARYDLYEWSFVSAACVMAFVAILWLLLFTPHQRTDIAKNPAEESKTNQKKAISYATFVTITGLAILAVSGSFIKDGLQNWIPTILKSTYSFTDADALILATSIYLIGSAGAFIVRLLNKYIKNYVNMTLIFYSVISLFMFFIILLLKTSLISIVVFFSFVMILNYGINNIITSLAPLSLRDVMNPGLAAGLLDGFCYAGSALSTYILGLVADKSNNDWSVVMNLLLVIAVCTIITTLAIELLTKRKTKNDS